MKTQILKVNAENPEPEIMAQAGEKIRQGQLVAFPTETVYGLAADVFNEDAVSRVFEVKGRPANNPLPVQIASIDEVSALVSEIPDIAKRLMQKFFPGPLTIVLPASNKVPEIVTSRTGKVGIRMPNHPVALELIRAAGMPIVAPSANTSLQPPPTTASEVFAYFEGKIEIILDAGETRLKIASTVVDVSSAHINILRQGSISEEELSRF